MATPTPRRRHVTVRPFARLARVDALLREVIGEEIARLADTDARLARATVTAVHCEVDVRHATVLLDSLSDELVAALAEHRTRLQAAVAAQARLRRTPTLGFVADPAVESGRRVEEALRRARKAAPESDAGEA